MNGFKWLMLALCAGFCLWIGIEYEFRAALMALGATGCFAVYCALDCTVQMFMIRKDEEDEDEGENE